MMAERCTFGECEAEAVGITRESGRDLALWDRPMCDRHLTMVEGWQSRECVRWAPHWGTYVDW